MYECSINFGELKRDPSVENDPYTFEYMGSFPNAYF